MSNGSVLNKNAKHFFSRLQRAAQKVTLSACFALRYIPGDSQKITPF